MRLSRAFTIAGSFLGAAGVCVVAASFAVGVIEDSSHRAVRSALDRADLVWAEVDTDGLQVYLAGTAPSEASRFKAVSVSGTVVDAARVIDQMLVEDSQAILPPSFSVEILRNESGVSLIGLVPVATDREKLLADIAKETGGAPIADLMDAADYPYPRTWPAALQYAVISLGKLPRAKISVSGDVVEITAMVDSPEAQGRIEADLSRRAPAGVRLALDISAPRPVITPFTLRFLIDEGGARFDACSADTDEARERILRAAAEAGLKDGADCVVGMGVPSPRWAVAAELSIAALARIGGGSITISDADIALRARNGTPQSLFDDVVGRLEADLPEVFVLSAVLPPPADSASEVQEFVATLSPEGRVEIRGRVSGEAMRETVKSFAEARFSSDAVNVTARLAEGLPADWALRSLTGLEALSYLASGSVNVTPQSLIVQGKTGHRSASAKIAQFLAAKLGEGAEFSIDVAYDKALDPIAALPTAEECETQIAEVQATRKIRFEPGLATIDGKGAAILDDIADLLKNCGDLRMEIGGHTDSQGRDEMNAKLSLERARAVLEALRQRRVPISTFEIEGYGETRPIADNDTEEGREINRRIEFRLIRSETGGQKKSGLESSVDPVEEGSEQERPTQDQSRDEQN